MYVHMTPRAFRHLQRMAQRTGWKLSSTGSISIDNKGLTVADVVRVRKEVSAAHVDIDSGRIA